MIVCRDTDDGIEVYLLRRSSKSPGFPGCVRVPGGNARQDRLFAPGAHAAETANGVPPSRRSPTRRSARRLRNAACSSASSRWSMTRSRPHARGCSKASAHVRRHADRPRRAARCARGALLLPLDHAAGEPASLRRTFLRGARAAQPDGRSRRARYVRWTLATAGRRTRAGREERDPDDLSDDQASRTAVGGFANVFDLLTFTETKKTIPVTPEVRPGPTFSYAAAIRKHVVTLGERVSRLRAPQPVADDARRNQRLHRRRRGRRVDRDRSRTRRSATHRVLHRSGAPTRARVSKRFS